MNNVRINNNHPHHQQQHTIVPIVPPPVPPPPPPPPNLPRADLLEDFVKNLVPLMDKNDLELQNKNYNTALSLAAAAGNVKTATIMVKKNPAVVEIPGNNRTMPLYMAALFAKPEMARYLYSISKKMGGDYWSHDNRGWVLQKCVEADIFVFHVKIGPGEKESEALQVLRIIWEKIATMPKSDIDDILRGQPLKEVEKMIPPQYRQRKNVAGEIPQDLFTKKHEYLVTKGEDWMKNTASQCMVVATLITTIVFAAAFTLPGGYNQTTGIPFFRKDPALIIFVISDAVSLISSSTSILMFLAILTSRYAERDFLESLPKKLMFGLATLFLSIVTMMLAFSASFFVLYDKKVKWIPITITGLAGMPVILFAILQFRLLGDVFYSTYGSRYLFKPKKRILYY
ncbi:hypothetical protein M8C21_012808 [Ambrosia artemisiifolia]|uniref:PGG domain-containing protein n=1 Tax=Ambrosia artemisiifolia TaxID=4212 RepID=A0AAD5BY45_AMBAR|nr:hypothetical protein M8C21_012808 [Ambrosia artemisiifolia]